MLEFLQEIDEIILLAINGMHSPFFDTVMWWVSGKYTWLPFYAVLLIFIFWKRGWKDGLIIIITIVLAVTLSDQTSVHLFKEVFQRSRPSHNPDLAGSLHFVNEYRGGRYGFISSHASNTFAVAGFLILIFQRYWLTLLLLFWALLVSYSRIYLGVHYFFDVLAGAVWGMLLAYLLYILYKLVTQKFFTEQL